jgi:hypothetical protein
VRDGLRTLSMTRMCVAIILAIHSAIKRRRG